MRRLVLIWLFGLALLAPGAAGQEPIEHGALDAPSGEQVRRAMERVRSAPELGANARAEILALYEDALAQLRAADDWAARAKEDARALVEAPGQLQVIREELSQPAQTPRPSVPAGASVGQLEQLAAQAQAELTGARQQQAELEAEQRRRTDRRSELPRLMAETRTRLQQLEAERVGLSAEGKHPELFSALKVVLDARLLATRREIAAHEGELASVEARTDLLSARRERAARHVTRADALVKAWALLVNEQRRLEAERATEEAQRELRKTMNSHPIVRAIANRNAELAEERTGEDGLVARIEQATQTLRKAREAVHKLNQEARSVEDKVDNAGLTPAIGLLLVDRRAQLRDVRLDRADLEAFERELPELRLHRIEREEEAASLVDLESRVDEHLAPQIDLSGPDRAELERAVREQLQQQRSYLEDLTDDYRTYIDLLNELTIVKAEIIRETAELTTYIDERVLWVRIAAPLHRELPATWTKIRGALAWLVDGAAWRRLGIVVLETARDQPAWPVCKILIVLVMFLIRPALNRRLAGDAYLVGRIRTDRFVYTVRSLIATTLHAVAPPLFLLVLADLLQAGAGRAGADGILGEAGVQGLRGVAMTWFVALLVWKTSRSKGLGEAHFRWPVDSLKVLRRHMRWLLAIVLPAIFVSSATAWHGPPYDESLGRLAFITGNLALTIFALRVLGPASGVLASTIDKNPGGWLGRLRWLWFPMGFGLPLAFAVLSALGYLYSAEQLQLRFQSSGLVILGLVAVHALFTRWLFVARRKLALSQYLKRRAAAQAEAEAEAGGEARSQTTLSDELVDEDDVDLPSVSAQSQKLVQTFIGVALAVGLVFVWADVLPALSFFDEVEVWSHSVEVEEPSEGDPTNVVVRKRLEPVTLADLLLALVTLVLTVAAARNLPGLLEITVLQNLPLQRAGRYAITTISRYLIVVIGIAFMFGSVGIGWSKVQWLAAAVTVGLGFGLQEIFANFVSGLILLFERPIRVGDTVTVANVTGSVTRIRMRATTIVTWERTELVVPNKEFITTNLVNWTLSDSIMRVIVRVGIAYGSDTKKAEKVLYQIARENPDVLEEPAPRVVFTLFGESSLDFELRVFVSDIDLYRTIHHSINCAIDAAFKEAGITIAFPQRDLHLKTSETSLQIVRREEPRMQPAAEPTAEAAPDPEASTVREEDIVRREGVSRE